MTAALQTASLTPDLRMPTQVRPPLRLVDTDQGLVDTVVLHIVPDDSATVLLPTSGPAGGGRTARGFAGVVKIVSDVTVAALLLAIVSPVLLALAVAIKLDGGPAFFLQTRVGRGGRLFRMVKFRSMVVDAERHRAELISVDEGAGPLFKMRCDPRITRIGGLLRRYSLDELPQLFNVLIGSMSLVGPRPPLPSEAATYTANEFRRLSVRPGMTGLWQVSGRSDLSWNESIALDLHYVDRWTPALELKIIAGTARAVLGGRGAY